MLLWVFILFILSLLNFFYDALLWLGAIKPIDPLYISFFNILFLLITLGILYRMYYLQRKGVKEKLIQRIKELEEEIKKLKGE
ncbi:MAG: hypothetical protein ABIM98_06195 [candidate division WOR-3 bacterium]